MRSLLAWKVQAEVFGDGGADLRRLLRNKEPPKPAAQIGTRLVREWQGVKHSVEISPGGVVYEGVTYPSLSKVARVITGVRWNGPRFFGLRADQR